MHNSVTSILSSAELVLSLSKGAVERVSKGAGLSRLVAGAAPFDTTFAAPFDKLRTQLQSTQDAYLANYA